MTKARPKAKDSRSNSEGVNHSTPGFSVGDRSKQAGPKTRSADPPTRPPARARQEPDARGGDPSSAVVDYGAMIDISWGCEGCVARLTAQHTTSTTTDISFEHTCPGCGSSYSVELAQGPRGPVWRVFPKSVTSKETVPIVIYPQVDAPSFDEDV